MNEYLYEIMDDKTEHDEMDEYVAASRKVSKHRGKSYSQFWLLNTLEDECLTAFF